MQFRDLQERIEFLRRNPIFWTMFGHETESGNWQTHLTNARRHKALYDKGILVHSSVIPSGWVGVDRYDYTELDALLQLLFDTAPDILFMPRVKLNVPEGWCAQYPEDVYVYAEGPRTRQEICAMLGTSVHGSHPTKSTDLLALQSLSSRQWVADASEALRRFVLHLENSPWAHKIIGYHVAYGTSGEITQWGSWDKNPRHKGDYGIRATERFVEYAAQRGCVCTEVPSVEQRFFIGDTPVPENRYHVGMPTLEQLFFHKKQDEPCVLYNQFTRDTNVEAVETLCRVVKELVPQKVTGVFYGYITEPENCANVQHTGFDRILRSPWVDFIAGPKGYNRVGPVDPGLGQAVPNSVNRKKLWVDEIDNRTHLCVWSGSKDYPARNFDQTRAVYWREFTKNVAFHQGYWWMDLGGGWLDSEEIQNEVQLLNETSKQLYQEEDRHENVSQVLLVIDEEAMHHMRPNFNLHRDTIHHTGSVIKESGVPVDYYRMADLPELDLSRYKMIVFLNAFYEDPQKLRALLEKTRPDCHILWNYAPGILNGAAGTFGLDNVRALTGFSVGEYPTGGLAEHAQCCYPVLYVQPEGGIQPLAQYSDGNIRLASRQDARGRTHILNAMPADVTPEAMQQLLAAAGVHIYAPARCVVHADSRFLYVLAEKTMDVTVRFPAPVTCCNVFTGQVFRDTDTVTLTLEEGTCAFLKYLQGSGEGCPGT